MRQNAAGPGTRGLIGAATCGGCSPSTARRAPRSTQPRRTRRSLRVRPCSIASWSPQCRTCALPEAGALSALLEEPR